MALDGLSVGDALGGQFFIPRVFETKFSSKDTPDAPWGYTDDTEMALAIAEVLQRHGRIDQDDLALTFAHRYQRNVYRGYGPTMHEILPAIHRDVPWIVAASSPFGGTGSLGNGAAMRAAPIGAYFADDLALVASEAAASAEVTHFHPEGQAGAIAVAVAAAWGWRVRDRCTERSAAALFEVVLAYTPTGATRSGLEKASVLPAAGPPDLAAYELGNGSRVTAADTVPFAMWCSAHFLNDYAGAIWATLSGFGDMDTNCAIVGGVVAMATGRDAPLIPKALRPAVAGVLAWRCASGF